MIEFGTPYLSTFVRSTLFRGSRILAARMHDFLSRLAGDLNDLDSRVILATNRVLLRRMTVADIVNMTGTDEFTLASVTLPAGVLLDGDQIFVNFLGNLNTADGSAQFTLRVYIRNAGGEDAVATFTSTPSGDSRVILDVRGLLLSGTPFGGGGPDTSAAYGSLIFDTQQPDIHGLTSQAVNLSLPISIDLTAQVDLNDGSKVEGYGWQIELQRAVIHPLAT